MAAREQSRKMQRHMSAIRKLSGGGTDLGKQLGGHSPHTIALVHEALEETRKAGNNPGNLAWVLRNTLATDAVSAKKLLQILPVLKRTAIAGHDPNGLAWALQWGLSDKAFDAESLPRVLELVSSHAVKGRDPFAIAAALQSKHLPPTLENIQALKEAEPHILKVYDLLHGVQSGKDHEKVSATLFRQVLDTYKTKLPVMGEGPYWKWIGLHAKELKANRTSIKPA